MKTKHKQNLIAAALFCPAAFTSTVAQTALPAEALAKADDPLPSLNDGKVKQAIIELVTKVTTPGSPDFVPGPNHSRLPNNQFTRR